MDESRKRKHSGTGPIGKQVGENLAQLRNARRLTTERLAEEVRQLGVEMTASTVTKIEKHSRRITVDELVAFAAVLDVSPVSLMLPAGKTERVQLAEGLAVPWERAWRWAHGEQALPKGGRSTAAERTQWLDSNRPYMSPLTINEVERLLEIREGFAPFHVEMNYDGERWGESVVTRPGSMRRSEDSG